MLASLLIALTLTQAAPAAEPASRVSGRVTLEGANAPVSGARIILIPVARPTGPFGPPPQATTDQDGRFGFDRVTPGTYRLDVQKTGLAPVDSSRAPEFTVAAGQSIDNFDMRMQKGAVITGRVLDPAGEPLPDARVMVFRRPSGNATRMPGPPRLLPAPNPGTQTNDIGEFRVAGLPPGEYFVAAMPRPPMMFGTAGSNPAADRKIARTTLPTTYYPGTTDQAAAQPIAVTAGAEVGSIFFAMQQVPAFRVSGIVVDEEGRPVPGAMVMLMGDPRNGAFTGPVGNAMSREGGEFDIDGVPAGSYRANGSIMVRMDSTTGREGVSAGGVSGGVVAGVSGGVTFGSVSSSSWTSTTGGRTNPPPEVVVADADVAGVRVVIQRPPRQ
jgi:protocatechuate 3,4-dioxygenase beta subunit